MFGRLKRFWDEISAQADIDEMLKTFDVPRYDAAIDQWSQSLEFWQGTDFF